MNGQHRPRSPRRAGRAPYDLGRPVPHRPPSYASPLKQHTGGDHEPLSRYEPEPEPSPIPKAGRHRSLRRPTLIRAALVTGAAILTAVSVWASIDTPGPVPGPLPPAGPVATVPDDMVRPGIAPPAPVRPAPGHRPRSRRGGKGEHTRTRRHHGPGHAQSHTRPSPAPVSD